eukprot:9421251-Pyramimonas_sp.AAC.2
MSIRSVRSLSSSAEVGNCRQNPLITDWKASLRSRKVMLRDLAVHWQPAMNAREARVIKSVAIIGRAPHCVASSKFGSEPITRCFGETCIVQWHPGPPLGGDGPGALDLCLDQNGAKKASHSLGACSGHVVGEL